MKDEFDSAGSGSRITLRELMGKTVLFSPTEYVPLEKDANGNVIGGGIMTTDYGRKDAVLTDLVVLDADGGPEVYTDVMIFNGKPIGVTPPTFVVQKVARTEPGFKGDTSSNTTKPAFMEGGLEVQVPLFIEEGQSLKIDTRTGEYVERVNVNK